MSLSARPRKTKRSSIGLVKRHSDKFFELYGANEDRFFRARSLRLTLLCNIPVLICLLIFFLIPGGDAQQRASRFIFAGVIFSSILLQTASYFAMMRNRFNFARGLFMGFTYTSILASLYLTGGFPSSIASPAIIIPIILSYCLYGGRVSLISSSIFIGVLIGSFFGFSALNVEFPDLRAMPDNDVIIVIIYASVLFIMVAMINIFDKTYREYLEHSKVAARAKAEFLATMSHEIRTPMNGVLGIAQVLEKTNLDPKQQEIVSIINRSGDTLLKIINDVLDYSKLESGKMTLEPEPINPRSPVHDTIHMLGASADKAGLVLKHDIQEPLPSWVLADGGRILQVLINLVGNGIKFTESGSVTITVSAKEAAGQARLRFAVTDTGAGIPEDEQAAIFDDFYQVDQSTTRKIEGTGLGLAICKQIIAAMGGRLGLTSAPGKGSTFWFELNFDEFGSDLAPQIEPNLRPVEAGSIGGASSLEPRPAEIIWVGQVKPSIAANLESQGFNIGNVKTQKDLERNITIMEHRSQGNAVFILNLPEDLEKQSLVISKLKRHPILGQRCVIGMSSRNIIKVSPEVAELESFDDTFEPDILARRLSQVIQNLIESDIAGHEALVA